MFHGRRTNSKINHIHERAQRIVYKNNVLSFEKLLELHKLFKIIIEIFNRWLLNFLRQKITFQLQ